MNHSMPIQSISVNFQSISIELREPAKTSFGEGGAQVAAIVSAAARAADAARATLSHRIFSQHFSVAALGMLGP